MASVVDNNKGQTVGSAGGTGNVTVVVPSSVGSLEESLLARPLHSVEHLGGTVVVADQIVVT